MICPPVGENLQLFFQAFIPILKGRWDMRAFKLSQQA